MLRLVAPVRLALQAADWPIIVTGAGGWLGQAALAALAEALGEAMPSRVLAFSTTPGLLAQGIAARPYASLAALSTPPALVLHFAFRTKGYAAEPDYVATNRALSAVMQGYLARNGARGLFVPSSGAVYGPDLAADPYGALKYEDELAFAALAQRLGFPAVIARLFNLAGPYMNNLTGYALACIITDILRGGPITLRAAKPVWRSYTHVGDVLDIALDLLLQGLSPPVFDSAGEEAVEIGELARRASRLLAGAELPITRPEGWEAGAPDRYLGDRAAYAAAAAQAGVKPRTLETQIRDTAAYIRAVAPGRGFP
jgi:nucleoside-diphosphate-sugar epimerase